MRKTTRDREHGFCIAEFIRSELSPFPGRYNAILRYLVSTLIVVVASISLNIPMLPYSMLVLFMATQQNIVLTNIVFPVLMISNTLAIGVSILVLKFTIDYPFIRLLSSAVIIMVCIYLMRASKIGVIFLTVAITVVYAQSIVDQTAEAELLTRNMLWMWIAGTYAIVIAYIVNTLLLPVEPEKQLYEEIEHALSTVINILNDLAVGKRTTVITDVDIHNKILTLYKNLKFSTIRNKEYKDNQVKYLAEISAVERIYSTASRLNLLNGKDITHDVMIHCKLLANECVKFKLAIISKKEYYQPKLKLQSEISHLPGSLKEMYSTLIGVSALFAEQEIKAEVPDLLKKEVKEYSGISYDYVKFATKVLLSLSICYIFYIGTQWPGIQTSMLTCIIVAQPGLGASIQKSILRITGCIIGSGLALFATIFILPYTVSIVGLLIMICPVVAFGAWVAAGSERSSYAGIQIIYAFSLAMFTSFSPTPDLPEIRDRVIGILLGICVATIVHVIFWPESEGRSLRDSIAKLLYFFSLRMSNLSLSSQVQRDGWSKINDTEQLLARVALEPNWRAQDNETLTLNGQTILSKLRVLNIAMYNLENEYAQSNESNAHEVKLFVYNAMKEISKLLMKYENGLIKEPVEPIDMKDELDKKLKRMNPTLEQMLASDPEGLLKGMLIHTKEIIILCESLPVWNIKQES